MSGLGKQLRGTGIAKVINARTGFKDGGESLKPVDKENNPGLSKLPTPVRNKMGYMKKGGSAKIGPFLETMGKYRSLAKAKELNMKKGGSAKPGLWANINKRKKLGISRSKSQSTISPKAYANMKAGFPKKKK